MTSGSVMKESSGLEKEDNYLKGHLDHLTSGKIKVNFAPLQYSRQIASAWNFPPPAQLHMPSQVENYRYKPLKPGCSLMLVF